MTSSEAFEDAQKRVKTLSSAPSNDDLLELYALYKQATAGERGAVTSALTPLTTPTLRRAVCHTSARKTP